MLSSGKKKNMNNFDKSTLKFLSDLGRSDMGLFNNLTRFYVVLNALLLLYFYSSMIWIGYNPNGGSGPVSIVLNIKPVPLAIVVDVLYFIFILCLFVSLIKYTLYFKLKKNKR